MVCESVPTSVSGKASALAVLFLGHDHLGQVFQVDLVDDAGGRRHDPEIVEGLLPPVQELVALAVALELQLGVAAAAHPGMAKKSTCTEWSITRSTGTSGLIFLGSPPSRATAARMAARSTTAGTPVKSCMITRAGREGQAGALRAPAAASRPG